MKILIVDDDKEKVAYLQKHFTEVKDLSVEDISVAECAVDAKRLLATTSFDLMILDILLPVRVDGKPSADIAIALLDDLRARRDLKLPRYIVGLTAYKDLPPEVEESFVQGLWTILFYDVTSDEWLKSISGCIDYIRNTETDADKKGFEFDVAIITTTSIENDAIHSLPWEWESAKPLDDSSFYRVGHLKSGGKPFSVASITSPKMGMVQSALTASKMITNLKPRFLIMVGICAGLEKETEFGDIILAETSWDYQSGKATIEKDEKVFAIDPHHISIPNFIKSRFEQLRINNEVWRSVKDGWPGEKPSAELRLCIGPVATGSSVVADGSLHGIKAQQRKLLGVEMEIYGLYAAAENACMPRPTSFALKSVSDFGNVEKDNRYQAYASYTSCQALRIFLEKYLAEIVDLAGT